MSLLRLVGCSYTAVDKALMRPADGSESWGVVRTSEVLEFGKTRRRAASVRLELRFFEYSYIAGELNGKDASPKNGGQAVHTTVAKERE